MIVDFSFDQDVLDKIFSILNNADKFIKIAVFQIHNKNFFEIIQEKLEKGVKVEVFTLPYDSIHENEAEIRMNFENIINQGAKVYFCEWNVGDPERTTTAVNKWYSFHGKFLVTDKDAVAFSANLTEKKEIDVFLSYTSKDKIENLCKKFEELIDWFVKIDNQDNQGNYFKGNIHRKIIENTNEGPEKLFELPVSIENKSLADKWIKHYPVSLCKNIDSIKSIEEGLYISPFDCRARELYTNIMTNASEFVYLCTETFTDKTFPQVFKKISLNDKDIRIITGGSSMDFQDRINETYKELLANGIKIRRLDADVHAKLLITEKYLVISSVNLNKINLGFYKSKAFWRSNTETIFVSTDKKLIDLAKNKFNIQFEKGHNITQLLAQKIEQKIGKTFTGLLGLKSKKEVKILFARLIIHHEIEQKKLLLTISKIIKKIMNLFNSKMVLKEHFIMALILYYLSERKQDFDQLNERLEILETDFDLNALLSQLIKIKFIEKENDFYKINVEKLF